VRACVRVCVRVPTKNMWNNLKW